MSRLYSTDNECLLTGGLWALLVSLIVSGLSLFFVNMWPTAIVVFVILFLVGFAIAVFMCKTRTVGRGGVDLRAVDLARAEMGLAAAPEKVAADRAKAESDAAAEAKAAEAVAEKAKAEADAKAATAADAATAQAKKVEAAKKAEAEAAKKAKAAKAKVKAEAEATEESLAAAESKPALLKKARGGKADDLKLLKGIGPKLESELNAAGVFHFDQIAGWTKDEVEWADQHLVSLKGRVSRDNWVGQAKDLIKK